MMDKSAEIAEMKMDSLDLDITIILHHNDNAEVLRGLLFRETV